MKETRFRGQRYGGTIVRSTKWQVALFTAFILLFIAPFTTYAQVDKDNYNLFKRIDPVSENVKLINSDENSAESIYDQQLIIKLANNHSFNPKSYDVELVKSSNILMDQNIMIVKVPKNENFKSKQAEIETNSDVIYTEPDRFVEPSTVLAPEISKNQWYLNKIDMLKAWEINQGSKDITIAVLDTGVNVINPVLKNRVLTGYDFINKDKNAKDDNGHGTQVAGIIAANTNSNMTGLDLHASILPVKVIDSDGNGPTSNVVSGIYYAIKKGVDVINMSYVNYSYSEAEEEALWEAYKQGITLVAAAGNEGWGRSGYPASYTPVISVSATDKNDKLASFSNFGNHIDLAAPGVDIYTLNYSGGYKNSKGSSFSAPIVSALAGMLAAQHPKWRPEDIEWALESSTKKASKEEWNRNLGYGRVNALKSFKAKLLYKQTDQKDYKSATKLVNKQAIENKLKQPLDVNWFTFDLSAPSKVTMTLENLAKHIDLSGVLYEYEGNEIHEVLAFNNGSRGEVEKATAKLSPGTYYLAVHDIYGKWSKDPYDIKISTKPYDLESISYSDVTRYEKEIKFLTTKGIIRGYPDGTFQPTKEITRLQAIQMILKEMKIDSNTYDAPDPSFTDVNPDSYGFNDIATAVDLGIIKGKKNQTFDSYDYLTRAQLAAILVKAYQLTGASQETFSDVPVDHWAHEVISTLLANEITKGYEDNTFRPNKKVSRAHFSVLLYNKIEKNAQ